jgi:hypothetical protein
MRVFVLPAAMLLLSGCVVIAENDVQGPPFDDRPNVERLYAASVEPGGVRVVAASNGCTSEESFDVEVEAFRANGSPRFLVRLERETPDRCRALMPDGVELFFSRERLGLSEDAAIVIGNSIGR